MAVKDKNLENVPAKTKRKISRLKNLQEQYSGVIEEMDRLKEQIQAEAVEIETSFTYRGITTVYSVGSPRTYWDGKALAEYAEKHPEIEEFAKTSEAKAYAYLRY